MQQFMWKVKFVSVYLVIFKWITTRKNSFIFKSVYQVLSLICLFISVNQTRLQWMVWCSVPFFFEQMCTRRNYSYLFALSNRLGCLNFVSYSLRSFKEFTAPTKQKQNFWKLTWKIKLAPLSKVRIWHISQSGS